MLLNLKVNNFKCFNNDFSFHLGQTKNYEFNRDLIKNGVVNKSMVYGKNGVGKSNLGLAIFDIVTNLTETEVNNRHYSYYLNANSKSDVASFEFEFKFDENRVLYKYKKSSFKVLISEELYINDVAVILFDRRVSDIAEIKLSGAENLKNDIGGSTISSVVSYVRFNARLDENNINKAFLDFVTFVDKMLYFRSLEDNRYIGIEHGPKSICADIVECGNIEKFEAFINKAGIQCKLVVIDGDEGTKNIAFDFDGKTIPFYSIASTGTKALALFYFWLQRLKKDNYVSLVFVDEFDAFYHHELAVVIVEELKEINSQVIITTHNTTIMSNDLLRPDCYFLMDEKSVSPLSTKTVKELRSAHNIEKLYKAGAFNG